MTEKGHDGTATFIRIVQNWFQACDKRGISADECVEHIFNMHKFLTEDIDFDKFPSKCCGRYIKGMLVQTFKGILQNISTRIFLYSMTTDGTYNARSISTLANESFFSDVNCLDKEGLNSYPKAVNMPKIIGKVVSLNTFKHKADKLVLYFFL